VAGVLSRLELTFARSAGGVGVIADGFRDYLSTQAIQPSRISRLRNWSNWQAPAEEREETRTRLGWGADAFICLHAGNMGHKQGLENLLDAAALLDGSSVRIVLAGDGNRRQHLEAKARALGLGNLSFLPPQAEGHYEAMLQAADLLLVNQRASVGDMALASKLTSYFAAGVAVLGAMASDSETGKEILLAGGGELVPPDDPAGLRAAILRLANDSSRRKAYGASGKAYAQAYLQPSAALAEIEQFIAAVAQRRCGEVAPGERSA
jgi:glycosyltransferase involved in cell wall biosynthesis